MITMHDFISKVCNSTKENTGTVDQLLFPTTLFCDLMEKRFAMNIFRDHTPFDIKPKRQRLVGDEKYLGQRGFRKSCNNLPHSNKSWFTV